MAGRSFGRRGAATRVAGTGVRTRTFCLAAALALALGTLGCFDYDEEVWLERNGSGRAEITVRMPEQLEALAKSAAAMQRRAAGGQNPLMAPQILRISRADAEKSFANHPGVHVLKVDEIREAGMVGFRISLSFDSLTHLEQALLSRRQNGISVNGGGRLSLVERGRSFEFHRAIAASKAGSGSRAGSRAPADQAAESMAAMLFTNHFLTYRYHFPFKIDSANATRIDPKTNTAEWKFGLADAMAGDLDMHAELTASRGPWVIAVVAIATAGIVSIIVLRYRAHSKLVVPAPPPPTTPPVRETAPRFRTREEYEAWKTSHRPEVK